LTSRKGTGKTYERYACTRARRRRDCAAQPIPRKILEQSVISNLHDYILQPDVIQSHQLIITNNRTSRLEELDQQRRLLSSQLGTIRRQITNVTRAIAEQSHSRALLDKLETLEIDEADLMSKISRLEQDASAPMPDLTTTEISNRSNHLRLRLQSLDPDELRQVLHGLIHRIDVERDGRLVRGLITCYSPPG
jgi:hypothetical protein